MACDARIIIIQIWIAALVLEELEYFGGKKLIWSGQILDEAFPSRRGRLMSQADLRFLINFSSSRSTG